MTTPKGSVLVTGGTSGIGAACVELLLESGYGAWVVSRRAHGSRPGLRSLALDVGQADVAAIIERERPGVEDELGPLVGFVHSAGLVDVLGVLEGADPARRVAAEAIHDRAMQVHFHGARRIAEALLPGFVRDQRGTVVLIDSAAGLRGFPGIAAYAAAKHALLGWARCAALEMPRGVSITSVCPYYVATPMLETAIEQRASETGETSLVARAAFRSRNPGGRFVEPEDVASLALELVAGDPAANNGRVIVLDGGARRDLPERQEPGLDLPISPQSQS